MGPTDPSDAPDQGQDNSGSIDTTPASDDEVDNGVQLERLARGREPVGRHRSKTRPPTQQPHPGPTHIHAHGEPLCDNCRQQVAPTQQQEKATTTPRTYTHPCTWRTPVRQLPTTSRPHTAARESNNHAQDLHTSMHMENPCATTADNKSPPHSSKRKQQPRPGPTHIHAHGEPLCDNCRQQVAPTQQQ